MTHGFQITEKLHETRRSVVYRAIRAADGRAVVLKMLNSDYPTPRELARYRQEFEIIRSLRGPGVIQALDLERQGNTPVIVLEDFGGEALGRSFARQRPTIEQLLDLAIQTAAALGEIHRHGVIHKDINPSNIVWNPRSGRLEIIDFGIATRLSSESPDLTDPGVLEGTLPYVSPEQTGRMNRRLDYRTDFYSLGVTLYELWTGQRPFDRPDALELVHCHIAAQARPPARLRDDTPPALSLIIMKLLAKTAEDRYQSAAGLVADLERCREQIRTGQEAALFPLGREDGSDRFAIPQKLYGREHELRALRDAFERVAQGSNECVLVSGYAGTGKSSLVRELYEPVTAKNAFFAAGKFDQLQRATPYSALASACAGLVKQLLTRSEDELRRWREAFLAALGPNGRLVIDLIPELELVIGPQPPVEELGPIEAQNRMSLAFCNLLRVFCDPAHPLVLFLDDLQWIDAATLRLLEPLLSSEDISHLLLIGAYRDNEVDGAHPLTAALRGLTEQGVALETIQVRPLGPEDVGLLLADTLHQPPASVRALAELVLRRTGGNPFFIGEFLKTLHEENLLRFDRSAREWRWAMAGIEATPVTDSVVELLRPKLRKFPEGTQELLRLAACTGNRFDLETIALAARRPPAACAEALMAAVREGYILAASEPDAVGLEAEEPQLLVRDYRFAHDRVQQAAYALIPADQRAAIHLEIGRLLLTRLAPEAREARLFELVDHLNLGRALLDTASEEPLVTPVTLARLNLTAGQRAKEAAAFAAAARYLAIGLELAGDAWDAEYDLALSLHIEGATAAYSQGDSERSQALVDAALAKVDSAVVKARLYRILIVQHTNQGRYDELFRIAPEPLRLLGQALPGEDTLEAAVMQDITEIKRLLGDRSFESLAQAPEVSDERYRAIIELLSSMALAAFHTRPAMYAFLSTRVVRLMLEHGPSVDGVYGYAMYGMMLSIRLEEHQLGYRFGALAMHLADRFRSPAAKCKCGLVVFGGLMPWARPLAEAHAMSLETFEAGLQSGELGDAAYTLMARLMTSFHQGASLARVIEDAVSFSQFGKRCNTVQAAQTCEGLRIVSAHLSDDQGHDGITSMEADAAFIDSCLEQDSRLSLGLYHVAKCQALYLDQEYERALDAALEAEKLRGYISAMSAATLDLYHSLCSTALLPQRSPEQREESWRRLTTTQQTMKIRAESCPENFRHMYLLVAAEMARSRMTGSWPWICTRRPSTPPR